MAILNKDAASQQGKTLMNSAVMQPSCPDPDSAVDAETQRQKTALLYRNSGIAQAVNIVNATLLAYVNASLHATARVAFVWWCFVVAIAGGRYLLARRFAATRPDAGAAMKWRNRYVGATAAMAAAWGMGTVLFMWQAPDSALLFTGVVLIGMVAGAAPLLAPVPVAFGIFAALVSLPMSAAVLLQANSPLHWAFGAMSLIFLAAMLASARYLHETLDVAIRLGLERRRTIEDLQRARSTAEAALTEREKLYESQRLLKAAVEQSSSSIMVTDHDSRIIFVNAGFTQTTGYLREEAIGQLPGILKSGQTPPETYRDLWATLANRRAWQGELCNRKKNGELYWEAATISPIVDAHGQITHYLGVKDDITQRKQVQLELQEQKNFLAAILENEPESVQVIDADGRLLQMNKARLDILEVDSVEEVNAAYLDSFALPEYRAALKDLTARVFAGETGVLEFQVQGKRGTRRWLESHAAPLRDASGRITHRLGVTRDITRKRLAEERLALALRGADLALVDWHIPGNALVLGDGWTKLLGYAPDDLPTHGSAMAGLMHPDEAPAIRDVLIRHLKGDTPFLEVEVRMRHKDGRWIWALARGMVVERAADGRAVRMTGTAMDITVRKVLERELTRLATTDPLTAVANRRRFIEQLEMELVRLKRLGQPAAFVMLDIDHFKSVNDIHGHAVGDGVLQHLAELSRHRLRRIDLFGRLGGEEFGILLPGTDEAGALHFAESFRRYVADTPFQAGAVAIHFTVSIGIAELNSSDVAADSIMARADLALYRAKEHGRNRVEGSRPGAFARS